MSENKPLDLSRTVWESELVSPIRILKFYSSRDAAGQGKKSPKSSPKLPGMHAPPIDDIAPWSGLEHASRSRSGSSPKSGRSPSPVTEAEALLHNTRISADNTEADHTMMGVRLEGAQNKIDVTMGNNRLLHALQSIHELKEQVRELPLTSPGHPL